VTDGMTTVPRRFSHSLVSTYLDCPRKAWFRYVETIPSPPAPALNYRLSLRRGMELRAADQARD